MRLLVQPRDGVDPVVSAIRQARKKVLLLIFRMDRPEVKRALIEAVDRGVTVVVLVAFTNRGGENKLRKLEADLLAKGVVVARTADDLLRYHGKMMIVDDRDLYLLAFNLTRADLRARSFGLVTRDPKMVHDATRLFRADIKRQPFTPKHNKFVVSPLNARDALLDFVREAKKELLIYDPKLSDPAALRVLRDRAAAGVRVRILGKAKNKTLRVRPFRSMRMHVRAIVRDGDDVFIGSQSLRKAELDQRREIGIIVRHSAVVEEITAVFEKDWAANGGKEKPPKPFEKVAKQVAKQLTRELPEPVVKHVIRAVAPRAMKRKISEKEIAELVKKTLKTTVKKAAKEALQEVA